MTKDELQAKRAVALSELKNIEVALCLDEHYIDILEKENTKLMSDFKICEKNADAYYDQLTKAREIILKLYNAGRDVLMCRAEEKAYDNLSNAINDKSIEQFLKEIEKC